MPASTSNPKTPVLSDSPHYPKYIYSNNKNMNKSTKTQVVRWQNRKSHSKQSLQDIFEPARFNNV